MKIKYIYKLLFMDNLLMRKIIGLKYHIKIILYNKK